VQVGYLGALLALLAGGAYLVVRQVLLRRELEEAAKVLGGRARDGTATPGELYELGCVMLRKKVFTAAVRHLEAAVAGWPGGGDPEEAAGVHNALGFAFLGLEKAGAAEAQFRTATQLAPGYAVAWNNLGDVLEKGKRPAEALRCYEAALAAQPGSSTAAERVAFLRTRLGRMGDGLPGGRG